MAVSVAVTIVIMSAQLLTSMLAAYAFAFLEFPFKRLMFAVVIGTLLLPIEVTLIANVQTIRDLGWLNSVHGPLRAVPGHRPRHLPDPPGLPGDPARPA